MKNNNFKTLIIIDANALIHRSFHALPDFRTSKGELVNAVYGFSSILLRVLRELNPKYVAAAFDVAGPTFRDEEYAEYKAKRVKAPDELYAQIPKVKEVLGAFDISIYEKEGFEADDIIGTISRSIPKEGDSIQTIIVSGDLDTLQLVDKRTRVYTMRKGLMDTVLYDEEAVEKRFGGLVPEQMVDYKGLRGDPSDNIPGVLGIGEKTAVQLLIDFGSLDNIYKEIDGNTKKSQNLKPSLREKLIANKDQAFFSRELATIRNDVAIPFKLEDLLWAGYDRNAVEKIFKELGFKSLLARLPGQVEAPKGDISDEGDFKPDSMIDPTHERIEAFYKDGVFSEEIYELEKKLVPVVRGMEREGIKIDKRYFLNLSGEIIGELKKIEADIYKIAGKKFNTNSPQQLSEVLFAPSPDGLSLSIKGLKKTPRGVVSTAAPELEKLKGSHPIIKELLKYRELQKLSSTYISPLPKLADDHDRIHTKFDTLGTSTGRMSSSNPNLQNIPIRGEWGSKIRRGFISKDGFRFLALDYSQMELRLAAHISGDDKMREYFNRGDDIHKMTAAEVFGISENKVTKDMRYQAKALNFGVLYGMGASGFAKSANISREEAQSFIDNYFMRFPSIFKYIEDTKLSVRKRGYAETIFGRRRYIPEINSSHPGLRAQAERMAINHPIQGSAADIIKMAMVEVAGRLPEASCKLLLQIHDELLLEVSDDKIKETHSKLKDIMENVCLLSVPLVVGASAGVSWGDLVDFTGEH